MKSPVLTILFGGLDFSIYLYVKFIKGKDYVTKTIPYRHTDV